MSGDLESAETQTTNADVHHTVEAENPDTSGFDEDLSRLLQWVGTALSQRDDEPTSDAVGSDISQHTPTPSTGPQPATTTTPGGGIRPTNESEGSKTPKHREGIKPQSILKKPRNATSTSTEMLPTNVNSSYASEPEGSKTPKHREGFKPRSILKRQLRNTNGTSAETSKASSSRRQSTDASATQSLLSGHPNTEISTPQNEENTAPDHHEHSVEDRNEAANSKGNEEVTRTYWRSFVSLFTRCRTEEDPTPVMTRINARSQPNFVIPTRSSTGHSVQQEDHRSAVTPSSMQETYPRRGRVRGSHEEEARCDCGGDCPPGGSCAFRPNETEWHVRWSWQAYRTSFLRFIGFVPR